jgi:hypothetical protein
MISESHKFILITPPKTASTSLVTALSGCLEICNINYQAGGRTFDYTEISRDGELKGARGAKHKVARSYAQEILSGKYKTFCSVRNPFDRMISWWKFTGRRCRTDLSFRDFIFEPRIKTEVLFRNLTDFITINENISVENFIRFEHLQDDFDEMCNTVKIPRRQLPHKNTGEHKPGHYTEYYDDETIARVGEIFKADLEMFNYKFGE